MSFKKKSIGQKAQERHAKIAAQPKAKAKSGGDAIDKIIALVNKRLEGNGSVFRGSNIQERTFARRSSGVPSIDFITSGGYPIGGLVEFGGEFSTGKTSLALEACAEEQRTNRGAVAWVALEPFSKKWARERGFFIPFCETEVMDALTGEMKPLDPFSAASELELLRMEQAGITDPYAEVSPFVLVQEYRGDVALDCSLDFIKSNQFAYVVVDSLGVAKSTSWLEEKEVQDAGDFPREAKMIGDYTARAVLALNMGYDENNQHVTGKGVRANETTVLHLNHIVTEIGTQARAKHKTQRIKGGEGNKHNHHAIIFLWKGELYQVPGPGDSPPYRYAQEVRCMCIKSKIGPPMLEGSYDFYIQDYADHHTGDIDVVKDAFNLGMICGTIKRDGAYYSIGEPEDNFRVHGRENMIDKLRESPDWFAWFREETRKGMRHRNLGSAPKKEENEE